MIKIKQQLPHGNSWHIQNLWRGKIKQLYCRLFTSYHPNDGSHTPQPSSLFIPLVGEVEGWEVGEWEMGGWGGGRGWERKNINVQFGVASRLHSLALLLSIWDSQWQRDWGLENGSSHHSEQKWTMSWHIHTTPLRLDYGWIVHKLGRWFWQAEENECIPLPWEYMYRNNLLLWNYLLLQCFLSTNRRTVLTKFDVVLTQVEHPIPQHFTPV